MHKEQMHKAMEVLTSWTLCECEGGKECFNIAAMKEIIDMIKDLAEASKECAEKEYYEEIARIMKEDSELDGDPGRRAGYDNWRYSSGRFAPTGHGHRSGYTPANMHGNVRFYEHMPEDMMDRDGTYPMMPAYYSEGNYPSKYGVGYDAYQMAKRHYQESKDEKYRKDMNERIDETVLDSLDIMREMMKDANPELKKKLKEHITKFVDEISRS